MSTHKIAIPPIFTSSADKSLNTSSLDKQLFFRIIKMLIICILISLALGTLFMYVTKPAYQVTSTFTINSPGIDQGSALSISKAKTPGDVQQNVNAEVDFLTSRSNLLRLVQRFNLAVTYRKVSLFHNDDLYLESPINFSRLRMGAKSSGNFSLTIQNDKSFLLKPSNGKAQVYTFNKAYTDDLGSWQISKTPTFSRYIGSTIRVDVQDPQVAADKLQSALNVSQSKKPASILKASIVDPVLTRGYDVLNALLISYLENSEVEKERLAQSQLEFINNQLSKLEQDLARLTAQMKSMPGATAQAEHATAVSQFLSLVKSNDQLLNRLDLKIAGLNELKAQLQSKKTAADDTLNNALADPLLNAMVRTMYETGFNYTRLLETHLPEDPEVTGTLQQLQRQKKAIVQEINAGLAPLLQQRKALMAVNARYAKQISSLPEQDRKRIELQRELQMIPLLYTDLVRSKEDAALNHASYLAFSKPLNSRMVVTENRHFSFLILLIGFTIPAGIFFTRALLGPGQNRT
jgi:tyrosine-protein kinase Etk/Wzc